MIIRKITVVLITDMIIIHNDDDGNTISLNDKALKIKQYATVSVNSITRYLVSIARIVQ